MRSQIRQAFANINEIQSLNIRLRSLAAEVVGPVPPSDKPSPPEQSCPNDIPMTEELRYAVDGAEQPLRELRDAVTWLEQMLGVEVASPTASVGDLPVGRR